MTHEEMRKWVWQKTMRLTIEMGNGKTQFRKGKYEAFKEMWEALGGDVKATVHMDENASEESKEAIGRMIEVAVSTYGEGGLRRE